MIIRLNLLMLAAMTGCFNQAGGGETSTQGPYALYSNQHIDFVSSNYGLYRIENDEAVCYVYESYQKGGISCKFKQ